MKTTQPSARRRTPVTFTDTTGTRIVVASRAEALFFDVGPAGALASTGRLTDATARLHDRDLAADRPGRVFDRAPPATGRRGAGAHHGTDGERSPHRQHAATFARRIVAALERDRRGNRFQRVALVAAPGFLGLLRENLKGPLAKMLAAHVPLDLVHSAQPRLRAQLAQMLARGEL
jgi:protein required for attachment to host cells